jgi:hypothetical protein
MQSFPEFTLFQNTTVPFPFALELESPDAFFPYLETLLVNKLLAGDSQESRNIFKAWLMLEIIAQPTPNCTLISLLEHEPEFTATFQITGFIQTTAHNLAQHLRASFTKDDVSKWLSDPDHAAGFHYYFKPYSKYKTRMASNNESSLIVELKEIWPELPIVRAASNTSIHLKGRPVSFERYKYATIFSTAKQDHMVYVNESKKCKTTRTNFELIYAPIDKTSSLSYFNSLVQLPDDGRTLYAPDFIKYLFTLPPKQLHSFCVAVSQKASFDSDITVAKEKVSHTLNGVTITMPCFVVTSTVNTYKDTQELYSFLPSKYPSIPWLKQVFENLASA